MFPSECLLECRVLSDGDDDLAATELPLFILKCNDKKAEGYADDELEICKKMLQRMKIGVRLADAPAVSYLTFLPEDRRLVADIVAVDKYVIVIRLEFDALPLSYLIYDAGALSLRMIAAPQHPGWAYTLTSTVFVARPCRGTGYALVHTGRIVDDTEDSFFLWHPSPPSPFPSPPWSPFSPSRRKAGLLHIDGWNETNKQFSFNGKAYWVDLLRGVFCISCNALFNDKSSSVLKFIPLPVKVKLDFGSDKEIDFSSSQRVETAAYRTMGIVRDSFIRFVSVDGFQDEYVQLKKRTVSVWKLLGPDKGWEKEHEFSLEALRQFEWRGRDLPKDLTPMYPIISRNPDVVYLGFGDYSETKIVRDSLPPQWEFFPYYARYMVAVDMRTRIVWTFPPMNPKVWLPGVVSCAFSRYLGPALVEPCEDAGEAYRRSLG